VLGLLVEAARAEPQPAPRSARTLAGAETIAPALRLIAERYREPLPVTRLARACGVSASHLRRLFVDELGASPREQVTAHRIELAACRLASGRAAIADIAAEVGFATLSSFNRLFRAHRGCSPREWRRRS
jgi:transcriptional regulator GlxA family with amidase domain